MLETLRIPHYSSDRTPLDRTSEGGSTMVREDSENVSGADNQQERPLCPCYVTGFVDAEGCFSVSVRPHPNVDRPTRWLMAPVFQCYQHKDGIDILKALRNFFGCGTLVPEGPNSNVITFSVHGLLNLSTRVNSSLSELSPPDVQGF
jgi:hypothetical protein